MIDLAVSGHQRRAGGVDPSLGDQGAWPGTEGRSAQGRGRRDRSLSPARQTVCSWPAVAPGVPSPGSVDLLDCTPILNEFPLSRAADSGQEVQQCRTGRSPWASKEPLAGLGYSCGYAPSPSASERSMRQFICCESRPEFRALWRSTKSHRDCRPLRQTPFMSISIFDW